MAVHEQINKYVNFVYFAWQLITLTGIQLQNMTPKYDCNVDCNFRI